VARHDPQPLADAFDSVRPSGRTRRSVLYGIVVIVAAMAVWLLRHTGEFDRPPRDGVPVASSTLDAEKSLVGRPTTTSEATPAPIRRTAAPGRLLPTGPPTTAAPSGAPARPEQRPAGVTATYVLTSSFADGFVPNVIVRNRTGAAQRWEVRLAYPPEFRVRVVNSWNATLRSGTGELVFTGGPLAAGAEIKMGFQAAKARPAQPKPTACSVNGVRC
jgi:hypothetical protein